MIPGSLFDPQLQALFQALGQALTQYTPDHFRTAYCIAEQAPRHAPGRLRYRIGSNEFPKEGTNQPSEQLHEAVYQLYRHWTKGGKAFPGVEVSVQQQPDGGWQNSVRAINLDAVRPTKEETDRLWDAVHDARKEFFEREFGPLPDEIQKLMNLFGVWPGGGLFQMAAPKHGGMGVCTTFGLTNVDMPTGARVSNAQRTDQGGFSGTLDARAPRFMPDDVAGYGYEVMVVTPKPDPWPLLPISWIAQMEILNDIDLPDRVKDGKGLTVESVKIGDGTQTADFLIERARSPWPDGFDLPNGRMDIYIATRITRDEMNFALKEGRPALFEKLARAGVGQVSHLQRPSVVK